MASWVLRTVASQLARASVRQERAAANVLGTSGFAPSFVVPSLGSRALRTGSEARFQEEAKDGGSAANQDAFLKKWSEVAPSTLDPPAFASEFMAKTAEPPKDGAPVPSKLTFNFYLPHENPYR